MSEGESTVFAWGGFIALVTAAAMAVKAAFTDDKKEDKQ